MNTKSDLVSSLSATDRRCLSAASSGYAASPPVSVKGVVAGTYFTAPVNSNNPANSTASSTVASVYQGAKSTSMSTTTASGIQANPIRSARLTAVSC